MVSKRERKMSISKTILILETRSGTLVTNYSIELINQFEVRKIDET